jgi:hypothetical protein
MLPGLWSGNTIPECFKNWKNLNTNYPILPAFICWNIWLERNRAIFDNGKPSVQKVVIMSLSSFERTKADNKKKAD